MCRHDPVSRSWPWLPSLGSVAVAATSGPRRTSRASSLRPARSPPRQVGDPRPRCASCGRTRRGRPPGSSGSPAPRPRASCGRWASRSRGGGATPASCPAPGEVRVILLDRPATREHGAPVLGATPPAFAVAPYVWVHLPGLTSSLGLVPRQGVRASTRGPRAGPRCRGGPRHRPRGGPRPRAVRAPRHGPHVVDAHPPAADRAEHPVRPR